MERSTPVCEISRKGVCSREEGGESDILIQGQVHQQEQQSSELETWLLLDNRANDTLVRVNNNKEGRKEVNCKDVCEEGGEDGETQVLWARAR